MKIMAETSEVINKYNVKYEFGKITLKAGHNSPDDCGSNGLPTTPNSISIIGNFRAIVDHTSHPNLVQYVDCYRSKNGKFTFSLARLLMQNIMQNIMLFLLDTN